MQDDADGPRQDLEPGRLAGRTDGTLWALRRKAELEAAMPAAPGDAGLRAAYFDHLGVLAAGHVGLCHALLPELAHPLHFRCATPDLAALAQVFRDGALDVAMAATPRRILVVGAHAGYGAVRLAHRHPQAEIACLEPLAANHRLLTLNTAAWPRIRALNVAAWHSRTQLALAARLAGDWSIVLTDRAESEERSIPALPIQDVLAHLGWHQADFLVCDSPGAAAAIFADPTARWLRLLDAALVRRRGEPAVDVPQALAACFDPALYERRPHVEHELFLRRVPLRAYPPAPPPIPLVSQEPGLAPLAVFDLEPVPWAFFPFDGHSCQLHPAMPGQPAPRLVFARLLAGHTLFSATLHHAGQTGAPVVFSMALEREDGSPVVRAERQVAPRERVAWSVPLPAPAGPHRVVLRTEMAPGAPNNHNAWARWLDPVLT